MGKFKKNKPAPCTIWGKDLDPAATAQMETACSLPIARKGALMPDAHKGYGLPIGGVLATENAVIPYAVGVDIACRMCMTVLDIPLSYYRENRGLFKMTLDRETRFGVGETFTRPHTHPIMDDDWNVCQITAALKDKAWHQLGTSGSGNHFAEFGELHLDVDDLGLERGTYLALLTHSGSRGTGAAVADHYSRLAKQMHPELPRPVNDLAWLTMDTQAGQEYWQAMTLMGKYAKANHEIIHGCVLAQLGASALTCLENHHNFAEMNQTGTTCTIIHRKGATPAGKGMVGIIPGSMADPAFVVRGRGNAAALDSAAHGAGRRMSRNAAFKRFQWKDLDRLLREKGVTLISAGLDEVPMAYKNIEEVMAQQQELITVIARFIPRLVKMAPPGRHRRRRRK